MNEARVSGSDKAVIENAYKSILNNEKKSKRDRKVKRPKVPKFNQLKLTIVK
jgi:hypothetical protein